MSAGVAAPAGFVLRYLGDPVLTTPCTSLAPGESIPDGLLDAMREVMSPTSPRRALADGRRGAGLAANQVGALVRVILVAIDTELVVMVNPVITRRSDETTHQPEGCLSIPGYTASIRRHRRVTVTYSDEAGASRTVSVGGVEAQCVQHEVDHLDGILITAGASRPQRRQAERGVYDLTIKAALRRLEHV